MMQHVLSLLIILVERILQFLSGWIIYSAQDQRRFWMIAAFQDGEITAVLIALMMLELCVQTVSFYNIILYITPVPRLPDVRMKSWAWGLGVRP